MTSSFNTTFLTNNPNLCSTSRILQSWISSGKEKGLQGNVICQKQGDFSDWLNSNGVPNTCNSMSWPELQKPWQSIRDLGKAALWLSKQKSQIIHCNEHDLHPFASHLKQILRTPLVCHVRYKLERNFAEWAFGGTRSPDVLLWTSHKQKADSAVAVQGIIPESRQHVVHLGIDTSEFGHDQCSGSEFRKQYGISPDSILIGIPAPLRPRKRIEDFIDVIENVGQHHERVVGIIAGGEIPGDESYRTQIENRVANSSIGHRLKWIGNLEPIVPFHQACDISVSTSEYETFGNSVCEAMACGKPVAAYQGGSVEEVIGDTGLVVETGDLEGLTRSVLKLVEYPDLRRSLGEKAKLRVEQEFNPSKSLEQLLCIYSQMLDRNKKN